MLPDFNRLRVFFHVHRHRSVTAAAAQLHVSQSAVSQSLARLEEELGRQLFVRQHRRLVPTPAADDLYGIVAPFVERLREGVADLERARHEVVGTLRIGAPVEFGVHRLVAALAEFRGEHPEVAFALELGHPSQIVPAVQEGRLDLAFSDVFDSTRWPGLDVVDVMRERLVLVAARGYERRVLAGARTFAALAAADWVAYHPQAPALRGWFRHHFSRVPSRPTIALAVESVPAVLAAVQHGLGVGVVPPHAVDDPAGRELVIVKTRRKPMSHPVSMLRPLDKVPTRAEQTFARFARDRDWR